MSMPRRSKSALGLPISRQRPQRWIAAWTGGCRYMIEKMSQVQPLFGGYGDQKWVTGFIFDQNLHGTAEDLDRLDVETAIPELSES
jgi:hypothetical protein